MGGGGKAGGQDSEIFLADSGFKPSASITNVALAKTDPDSIFWTMFRNQVKKPVLQLNKQFAVDPKEFEEDPAEVDVRQTRIDFRSQRLITGTTGYRRADNGTPEVYMQERCVAGKLFTDFDFENQWEVDELGDINCMQTQMDLYAGDGIAPGGLTDDQADEYINYVQTSHDRNPVSAGKPELVTHQGRPYVKLPVKIMPE